MFPKFSIINSKSYYHFSKIAFMVFRNFFKNILQSFRWHYLSTETLKWEIYEMQKTFKRIFRYF